MQPPGGRAQQSRWWRYAACQWTLPLPARPALPTALLCVLNLCELVGQATISRSGTEKVASVDQVDLAGRQAAYYSVLETLRNNGIVFSERDSATHDLGMSLRV